MYGASKSLGSGLGRSFGNGAETLIIARESLRGGELSSGRLAQTDFLR